MNKLFLNNFGDLVEAQRASFYRFLSKGISEEFLNFSNPFLAKIRLSLKKSYPSLVYLYPNEIKLKGPNFSLENCLKQDLTYSIQLFIPGEYFSFWEQKKENLLINSKKLQFEQDIFFGELPLMTEDGTFLINGCERVVISQIIRSPGIYFRKEFQKSKKTIYTATLISNKGLWTKIILDQVKLKSKKKKKKKKKV